MAARTWPTSPNMRWTWTPARWWRPRCTQPTRATPPLCRKRWRARPRIWPTSMRRRPPDDPTELVADKGYHSRAGLKQLEDGPWKSRVAEPRRDGFLRWHGDDAARRAVYNNRARLLSEVARQAFKLRAELVERGFALILDRGGMRRAWLRGRENVHKRYLVHVAGYNLGLIMRLLTGAGTPRGSLARVSVSLGAFPAADGPFIVLLIPVAGDQIAALAVSLQRTRSPETRLLQRAVRRPSVEAANIHTTA